MIDLIGAVRSILDRVEDVTGKGFRFIEKEDLPARAGVRVARRDMPEHIVVHQSKCDLNHLVAHECGHILRIFSVPPERRKVPVTNEDTRRVALGQQLAEIERICARSQFDRAAQMINLWYDGNVRQVTNQPVDTMIEKWLCEDYPELRTYQAESLKTEMRISRKGLTTELADMIPSRMLEDSNTMNSAYFRLLTEYTGFPLFGPYEGTRFEKPGVVLAELTKGDYEDNYDGDIKMIKRWTEHLKLEGWYQWGDFESVPGGLQETN